MTDGNIIRLLGACGVVASQLMNLSVIPSLLEIISARSTLSYPSFPIVIGLTNGIHNILYAFSRSNTFVIFSSLISLILNSAFLFVHICFSRAPSSIGREVFYFPVLSTALSLVLIASEAGPGACMNLASLSQCLANNSKVLGIVSTVVSTLSYCGQLSTFRKVIRTRNSSSISPWMTAGVLLRASCWFAYSYLIDDKFYLTSTSIGLVSAITQITLLILYPRAKKLD
jgi:uncharacterized protein with PQ loop repeat